MKSLITALVTVALLMSHQVVRAEVPFESEIEARQSFMHVMKFYMGILGDMAKGKVEYNAELADTTAKNIYAASQFNNGAMWPQGSGNDNPKLAELTGALPAIWTSYPKVAEKHQTWSEASAVLAENAGKGLDSLRQSIGPVGKSCKGCHDSFKAD